MIEYGLEWHSLDTYFQFKEVASAPSTPQASQIRLYAKDSSGTSTLCYKNDAGTEVCFPTAGPLVTGSGVANQLAIWSGTSTLVGDTDLTFVTDTLTATKIVGSTSITDSGMTAGSMLFAGAGGLISQDNANLFWDDANNYLGLGIASGLAAKLHIKDQSNAGLQFDEYNSSDGVVFRCKAAQGTIASPTALVADAVILGLRGFGWTSAASFGGAAVVAINLKAAESFTSTAQGSYLTFETTPLLSTTRAERFRIGPSGQWGIGGATYGTSLDVFTSGGASAAPTWTAPGALTKTDDTNVTLTLGGTPTTALLRAASLTLGWTGTLAVARGGTGQSTVAGYNALLDHGALLGLSDDDHTQYALLAGRSGGQTLIGGTASGNDLTLQSTAHATKGNLFFGTSTYDEVNNRLGVVTTTPQRPFHLVGTDGTTTFPTIGARDMFVIENNNNCNIAFIGGTGHTLGLKFYASGGAGELGQIGYNNTGSPAFLFFNVGGADPTGLRMKLNDVGVLSLLSTTSQIDLSAISAGSPNFKATFTSDTPTTTWTAGVPSNNPAGYIEWLVGATTYYQPLWI